MKPFEENLSDPREALVAKIREKLGRDSFALLDMLFAGIASTGMGQCKLQCCRMGDTKIGGIVFVIATEMSEADQRRFTDFAQGFVQDVSTADGHKAEFTMKIDDLPGGRS